MPPCLTLFNILNVILLFDYCIYRNNFPSSFFFVVLFFEAVLLVAQAELKLTAVSLPYSPEC